jgi:hypothetical protein
VDSRFYATFDNDLRVWFVWEREAETNGLPRLIAGYIPTAMWAEAMVEWMNSLEFVPELASSERVN